MRGVVLLFLLSLWSGGQVDAINQVVLANVVQEMRRFGLENRQFAMAVRLTQEQCQNQVHFDLNPLEPLNVQNKLNNNTIYTGNRLIAATPRRIENQYTDHAEYRLLSRGNTRRSPMETLIRKAGRNTGQCIVFFSTYSPCLEKCNGPDRGDYNIIQFMNVFKGFLKNQKAFVFSSVWEPKIKSTTDNPVTNPPKQQMLESFQRIEKFIPLYRCDGNGCYRCVTNGNKCLEGYDGN